MDGCIHWLVGSSERSAFYRIWKDLGALEGKTIIDFDEYGRFEGADGKTFIVYADIDKLERHMKELAPEDVPVIDEFIAAVRKCTRFEPPIEKAAEVMGLFDLLKMIVTNFPLLRLLWKWNKVSLTDFGNRFKNRLIREAFPLHVHAGFPHDLHAHDLRLDAQQGRRLSPGRLARVQRRP